MHRTLLIPEIVGAVFEYLDPTRTEDSDVQTQELAALARTCTDFHDIALDALWRCQDGILNLIRCMPADLWETFDRPAAYGRQEHILRPTRALVPSDWDRLLKYSHRIKVLSSTYYQRYEPNDVDMMDVFSVLRHNSPTNYLLPNLLDLTWNHRGGTNTFPFIDLFLGPRLTSLSIAGCPKELLPTLARDHSDLTVIRMSPNFRSPSGNLDEWSAFIRSLTHAKCVDVTYLDVAAFMHLGTLGSLVTLNVVLQAGLAFPTAATSTLFSNLESAKLSLAEENLRPMISFVRSWSSPRLYTFEAPLHFCPTPTEVEELYRTLASHCSHDSLEALEVTHYDLPPPERGDPARFVNPGAGLRTLFCFTRLQAVDIHAPAGFDFDDALLADMARAWPDLTDLCLGCTTPQCAPRATLAALRVFAAHCPHLRGLELTLDATNVPAGALAPSEVVLHPNLLAWNASYSSISEAFPVARFLSAVFVNLTDVTGDYDRLHEHPEYRERWGEVKRLLPGLGEIRNEEWTNGQHWTLSTLSSLAAHTMANGAQYLGAPTTEEVDQVLF
ncbi:hypothetical protein C8R46DRAFT_948407 [Mycena filopes]|nr:hypothetical protein C8R46DRAFT_948407 [Mycena filopes]